MTESSPRQFSLFGLLILTTIVATVLSIGKIVGFANLLAPFIPFLLLVFPFLVQHWDCCLFEPSITGRRCVKKRFNSTMK